MLRAVKADIETDASGDATVYLTHGLNRAPRGLVFMIIYTPGTLDTGTDLTITGETSGVPILTAADVGTDSVYYFPRALINSVVDGSQSTNASEMVPVHDERIKVVVAGGGATKAGSIEAILLNESPY
jgi:hypothetical protein